jgi:heme exporter protein C
MVDIANLANPTNFMRLTDRLLPWLIALAALLLAAGLYFALFVAPEDYQQGQTVRIMFVHVPAAWVAMGCYGLIAVSSAGSIIWRHPLADVSAKAAAPIGAAFTFLGLVTGSLWGRPEWGAYWVWDARLTSFLILLFLYLGLIAMWQAIEEPSRAGRAAAILALVGSINLPIIHFSVEYWNSLHQPAGVVRGQVHHSILTPLLLMLAAYSVTFIVLYMKAMRAEILRRRVEALMIREVELAGELKAAE